MTNGLYLNKDSIEENRRERREEKAAQKRAAAKRRVISWAALIICDMALIAMVHFSLIDQRIGIVALAAVSAALGRETK